MPNPQLIRIANCWPYVTPNRERGDGPSEVSYATGMLSRCRTLHILRDRKIHGKQIVAYGCVYRSHLEHSWRRDRSVKCRRCAESGFASAVLQPIAPVRSAHGKPPICRSQRMTKRKGTYSALILGRYDASLPTLYAGVRRVRS